MHAPPSMTEKQIQYHTRDFDCCKLVYFTTIAIIAVTVLVIGILANLHAEGIWDCKVLAAISWLWSVVMILIGGWFLLGGIGGVCQLTTQQCDVEFSESDCEWTPRKSHPGTFTPLGKSISVTQPHGTQQIHLFPDKETAEQFSLQLRKESFCELSKLAAETGATIYKHAEDPIDLRTLDTFIDYTLDIEPWERAFQELSPDGNAYVYRGHKITNPVPQDVIIYSVLTHVSGERAIHFFMNQAHAREYILTLNA